MQDQSPSIIPSVGIITGRYLASMHQLPSNDTQYLAIKTKTLTDENTTQEHATHHQAASQRVLRELQCFTVGARNKQQGASRPPSSTSPRQTPLSQRLLHTHQIYSFTVDRSTLHFHFDHALGIWTGPDLDSMWCARPFL